MPSKIKGWAKMELRKQGVQTLHATISVVDRLLDFKYSAPSSSFDDKNKGGDEKQSKGSKKKKCFICNRPYRAHDYPKREKINVLIVDDGNLNDTDFAHSKTGVKKGVETYVAVLVENKGSCLMLLLVDWKNLQI
ncbi:hypothetical protein FEM48_Zijuj01G0119600 [Ziziphus jujuba var. spinosa]|uniref:Uncharacterized protein n=1 Tax=Ziziphus jujuba var. spinosa TaxID=714518 RepID=A0A978W147_ZIZJJ|nr:hypothetical protein FEM48_Zijuj01G0119600 [Ziziphus jujuba var. spinosa]